MKPCSIAGSPSDHVMMNLNASINIKKENSRLRTSHEKFF